MIKKLLLLIKLEVVLICILSSIAVVRTTVVSNPVCIPTTRMEQSYYGLYLRFYYYYGDIFTRVTCRR